MIWTAGVGSVYAIMMALSMGFKEIYLLGIDHSYLSIADANNHRFYEANKSKNESREKHNNVDLSGESMNSIILRGTYETFRQYALFEKFAPAKITNLSHKSLIDIFEKKDYLETLRDLKII